MGTPSKNHLGAGQALKDTENPSILKAILSAKQPLSRRQISEATGREQPPLCRALFNLVNKRKLLTVAFKKPCITTGKRVYHYYFADKVKGGAEYGSH